MTTLVQLQDELVSRIKDTTTFNRAAFDIYDLNDLTGRAQEGIRWPMAGVAYERTYPLEQEMPTGKVAVHRKAAITLRHEFSVMIGSDYQISATGDRKDDMLTLLEEIRQQILGFRGINSKPWALQSEQPMPTDLDGVIFYGQLWATDVVQVGAYVEN